MVRAVLRLLEGSGAGEVVGPRRTPGREHVVACVAHQKEEQGGEEKDSGHGSNHALIQILPRVAGKTPCIDFLPELI
jgi:hypothetical protein